MAKIWTVVGFALALGLAGPALAAGSGDDQWASKDPLVVAAVAAVNKKDYSLAVDYLTKAVKQNPKDADTWNYLGFSQRKLQNYDAAEQAYKTALTLNPNHKGALEYQGELFLQTNRLAEAKKNLEKLDSLCFFGCDEHRQLKEAIEKAGG